MVGATPVLAGQAAHSLSTIIYLCTWVYIKPTTRRTLRPSNKDFNLYQKRMCNTCRTCEWKDCLKNNQIPWCNVIALWLGMAEGSKSKRKIMKLLKYQWSTPHRDYQTFFQLLFFPLCSIPSHYTISTLLPFHRTDFRIVAVHSIQYNFITAKQCKVMRGKSIIYKSLV